MVRKADDKFNELRKQAERLIDQIGLSEKSDLPESQELLRLTHELEVHQVELELQHRELQQTNRELAESRQRYRDLFDNSPAGYIVTDSKSIIQEANLTFSTMMGIERGKLEGRSLTRFVHVDDKDSYYLCRQKTLETDKDQQCRILLVRPDDDNTTMLVDMRYRKIDDNTLRCSVMDVTELHEAEIKQRETREQRRILDKLRKRMITTLGHELRTPLSSILLNTELLERYDGHLSDEQHQRIDTIKSRTNHIIRMLEQMIASNPYDLAVDTSDPEQIAIPGLVQDILATLDTDNRVQYTFNNQTDTASAHWNRENLRRILVNLLSNALKYSQDDVTLHIDLLPDEITINVADEGTGIPDEAMPNIFELFYRAPNIENIPGMGIGLNVVQRVLALHGGTIDVDSTLDNGTTVTVRLPRHLMTHR